MNASKEEPATEFGFFPRLPAELRMQIWNLALPQARVVEVQWHVVWWAPSESKQPASGLLGVNHESREVFLKHWLPICRHAPSELQLELDGSASIFMPEYYTNHNADMSTYQICYFNPTIDILYIGPSSCAQFIDIAKESDGYGDYYKHGTYSGDSIDALARISGMSKLRFLVVSCLEWDYYRELVEFFGEGRTDIELLSQFPSLERFDIGQNDVEWPTFNSMAESGQILRQVSNGHPMEVTLQELSLSDSLCDYLKKKFIDANGDQFMEWKVSFGVVQILRDGMIRGRSLGLPPEQ